MSDEAIHTTRWGESGPTVIMVHGGVQGSESGGDRHFIAQSRLAERGWQVLVPDRPGHGRSPAPGRPDDAAADGRWVADLLGDGAHLVGHSFGGCVALAAAAKRPDAVRSLTLIEPAMQSLPEDDPHVQDFGKRLEQAILTAASPAEIAARFTALVGIPAPIRNLASREELTRVGEGIVRLILPTEETLREQLVDIRKAGVPLLVVSGGWNPAFEAVAVAVASEGGGRHVVIPSEHHLPQVVSDAFNDLLEAFMKECDADAEREAMR